MVLIQPLDNIHVAIKFISKCLGDRVNRKFMRRQIIHKVCIPEMWFLSMIFCPDTRNVRYELLIVL